MELQAPVFVVSAVRSGSTLLRLMLDSHPDISNPGECDFMFDQVSDRGELPDVASYERWLSTNRIYLAHGLSLDANLSYPALMKSFTRQLTEVSTTLTLNVHRNFHRIPLVFPEARYIHLVRDPRDVARSCVARGWAGHVYYGVDIWKEAELSWERLRSTLASDRYIELRYEDLMQDVPAALATTCEFLGVEYSKRMMDYAGSSTYDLPDSSHSHQWKDKYSERELGLVEGKVADLMRLRGYAPSGVSLAHPGPAARALLAARHKSARFQFRKRKYGLLLCIEQTLCRKLGWRAWRESCQRRTNLIDIRALK